MWRGAIRHTLQLSDAGALTNGDDVVADTSVAVSTTLLSMVRRRAVAACADV